MRAYQVLHCHEPHFRNTVEQLIKYKLYSFDTEAVEIRPLKLNFKTTELLTEIC